MAMVRRQTSIDRDTIKILHLSDLHFSIHADEGAAESTHDHKMLARLSEVIPSIASDLVLVSGDLTDDGNRDQLLRVRSFLFETYEVSPKKRVGLSLAPEKVRLLPGNHDAFNLQHEWLAEGSMPTGAG